MGSFDGKQMARDGVREMDGGDINAFGQEWQVGENEPKLFRSARFPQAPGSQCILPSGDVKTTRRLGEGVSRRDAEQACAGVVHFDKCIYDVMQVGDVEVAEIYNN